MYFWYSNFVHTVIFCWFHIILFTPWYFVDSTTFCSRRDIPQYFVHTTIFFLTHFFLFISDGEYKCDFCAKFYKNKYTLGDHMQKNHYHEFLFHCTKCRRGFLDEEQFIVTVSLCVRCAMRQYQCYLCRTNIRDKYTLRMHMNTHTGERPFKCNFPKCQKSYSFKHALRRHEKIHLKWYFFLLNFFFSFLF